MYSLNCGGKEMEVLFVFLLVFDVGRKTNPKENERR
jgi:hypothetical protein